VQPDSRVVSDHSGRALHAWMLFEHGGNVCQLDAVPKKLDLTVATTCI